MRVCRYQAAIVDDGRILLVQHREAATGRSYWVPPGGGIEVGETEEECVRREVMEETGLEIEVLRLLLTVEHTPGEGVYRQSKTFLCRAVGGVAAPGIEPEHADDGSYEIVAVAWVPLDDSGWPQDVASDPYTTRFLTAVRDALHPPATG